MVIKDIGREKNYKKKFASIIKKLNELLPEVNGKNIKWETSRSCYILHIGNNYIIIEILKNNFWPIYVGNNGIAVYFPVESPSIEDIPFYSLENVFSIDSEGRVSIINKGLYKTMKERLKFGNPLGYFTKLLGLIYKEMEKSYHKKIKEKKKNKLGDDFDEFLKAIEKIQL